ncbi:hypothetical protein [Helicobacter ailurogastricus]|uniref:hypothetical protein n=1 Tax=Helicobacter ailurogastricus TaxID=1578720 RepID=UPI001F410C9A|nr:hypothetical protein [Helicobacter ailurogastricus]
MITLSVTRANSYMATQGWQVEQFSGLETLALTAIECDTSPAIFGPAKPLKSQRSSHNVVGFHNVLFFDIDNAPSAPYLGVKSALELMQKHPISFAIIPTRNHLKQKPKDSRKGVERFRILVPTLAPPPTALISRENGRVKATLYRIFQALIVRALKLETYADSSPLRDIARYYAKHETPPKMCPIVVEKRPMNLEFIYKKALELNGVENDSATTDPAPKVAQKAAHALQPTAGQICTADIAKIKRLSIVNLIKTFEKVREFYKEGTYLIVKTQGAKYSVMAHDNLVHDFKSGETYGALKYLMRVFDESNLNNLARKLERRFHEPFLLIDSAFYEVLAGCIAGAKCLVEVEQKLKNHYGVRFVKFTRNGVKVGDRLITYPPNFDKMTIFNLPLKEVEK